jgi:septal ring factor EnvC (AmiA/AmiB activator)
MAEYIVIGIIIAAFSIACLFTIMVAKKTANRLAAASTDLVEVVGTIKMANQELIELRDDLDEEQRKVDSISLERRKAERRVDERRAQERRNGGSTRHDDK